MSIRRQRGLSFVELIIFMVVVGIALVAILNTMNVTTKASGDPLRRKQALMIAESLMEEVQLARFTYCDAFDPNVETATAVSCSIPEVFGPEANNSRPFDNVNDYVNAAGVADLDAFNNGAGLLSDVALTALPDAASYSASLTIAPATLNGIGAPNVLLISITVSYAGANDPILLDGYRLRYAPNAPP